MFIYYPLFFHNLNFVENGGKLVRTACISIFYEFSIVDKFFFNFFWVEIARTQA